MKSLDMYKRLKFRLKGLLQITNGVVHLLMKVKI